MKKIIFLLLGVFLLTGCQAPLSDDKRKYIGRWESNTMTLVITKEGYLEYEKLAGIKKSLSAPIKSFTDDTIVAGLWLFTTEFHIDQPPQQANSNGLWSMVIDGETLYRTQRGIDTSQEIPTEAELHSLADQWLGLFNTAVKAKDFADFRAQAAAPFREQISSEKLLSSFDSFVSQSLYMDEFLAQNHYKVTMLPVIRDGALYYAVQYQASSDTHVAILNIDLAFMNENSTWKMARFNIDVNSEKRN